MNRLLSHLALKSPAPKRSVVLHVLGMNRLLSHLAVAPLCFFAMEFEVLTMKTGFLVPSRRSLQKGKYGVAFVSKMLEVNAMVRDAKTSFASSVEWGAFVFGFGQVQEDKYY